jgi:hypothetical protein
VHDVCRIKASHAAGRLDPQHPVAALNYRLKIAFDTVWSLRQVAHYIKNFIFKRMTWILKRLLNLILEAGIWTTLPGSVPAHMFPFSPATRLKVCGPGSTEYQERLRWRKRSIPLSVPTQMFPSRSSRTQYVLFAVKPCFALKVSMEGPNPFSFRRGSCTCERKRQIPPPPFSSVCQKPPSRIEDAYARGTCPP